MKSPGFEFIPHTADVKFRAYGKNMNELFENSALAMANAMYSGKVNAKAKKKIMAEGKDFESLLYNFLEKFLILIDSENFILSKIKVKIDEDKIVLIGEASGDNVKNYPRGTDIKAVTYNEMFVKKIKDKWVCQVVLDV